MDSEDVKAICDERLGKWTQRLVGEHSTPVLLLGVGHDHKKGDVVVCTLEDMDDADLLLFLRSAVWRLEAQGIRRFKDETDTFHNARLGQESCRAAKSPPDNSNDTGPQR